MTLRRWVWPAVAILAAAAALVVWVAPAERTLGESIRIVYIHVSLIWAGMLHLAVAGLLGAALAWNPRPGVEAWMAATGRVALGLMVLGGATSGLAARLTWGGLPWDEPRMVALLKSLGVLAAVLIAGRLLPGARVRGALTAAAAVAILIVLRFSPLVLHPEDPVGTSISPAIRLTFIGLFGICAAAGGAVAWWARYPAAALAGGKGKMAGGVHASVGNLTPSRPLWHNRANNGGDGDE